MLEPIGKAKRAWKCESMKASRKISFDNEEEEKEEGTDAPNTGRDS